MLNYLCIRCGIFNIGTWSIITNSYFCVFLVCLFPRTSVSPGLHWAVHGSSSFCWWSEWLLPVAVVTHLPFSLGGKGKKEVKGTRELKCVFWERGGVTAICCVWGKGKNVCVLKRCWCNWQDVVPLDCLLLMSLAGGNPSIPDNCSPLLTYSSHAFFITLILFVYFLISSVSFWGQGWGMKKMEPNSCQMTSKRTRSSCHSCSKGISSHLREGWVEEMPREAVESPPWVIFKMWLDKT